MSKLKPEQIIEIMEWRNKGATNEEIGQMFRVSRKTVAYWVKRLRDDGHEIKRFGRGGRPKLELTKK